MEHKARVRTFLISAVVAFIVGYALFRTHAIIMGPSLEILSPENGATLAEPLVEIRGEARRIDRIELNERQIFTDEHGGFSETLLLGEGYNILSVHVKDRFGRQTTKTLELVYTPNN